ncbi:hypothetical protein [Pedobacter steynii]|uniref:Uncharacterized protein n=1 Tax=Pedobacter steynii TaxID=430522 RepID=A0A1D7QBH3_9SPHI|nr:hypothetical protein [Pedobacter steynii]AOM75995.1 hypothetical protein BFS30_01740 [Pedobacter steynii]
MPTRTKSYAFCADYTELSACLFAIQALEDSGGLDAEASRLLDLFEKDVLRKLYLRTLRVLGVINNVEEIPKIYVGGDFSRADFTGHDFRIGYLVLDKPNIDEGYLLGDFEEDDYSALDFHVGYQDHTNSGYSSTFQTILNIFGVLCSRSTEISEEGKAAIDAALIPVLDAIEEIQQYLTSKGLNPCGFADDRYLNNSPAVYLQASGSDGADGVAEGLHLRWSLSGELGSNHMPKGDYNNTTVSVIGFNKPDDYAYISRTPYVKPVRMGIDFENDQPVINFSKKMWTYVRTETVYGKKITNRIRLTFMDAGLYNQLATTLSPSVSHFEFLNEYSGLIQLEVVNKTSFVVAVDFENPSAAGFQSSSSAGDAVLKMEALCQSQNNKEVSEPVHIRKTVVLNRDAVQLVELSGENIRTTRLKTSSLGTLKGFYFETYHDFLITRNTAEWTAVGNRFALSLTDAEVFDRLENSTYPIDNRWPHYNNGTLVRASNYRDKWSSSRLNEPGIKEAVSRYLALSETDPRAEDVLKDEGAGIEAPGLLVSYLDILNMQAMDYHMARMLGLGHIDVPANTSSNDQFIYRLNYTNRKALNSTEMVSYTYTSLPVKKVDARLPEKPEMRALNYGLPVMDAQTNNTFDEQGYTSLDQVRAINIGRKPSLDEVPEYDFFADLSAVENDNIFEHPKAVLYGIEYRAANQTEYIKPEITHDKSMGTAYYAYDPAYPQTGVLETVPVPDDPTSLYIHFERKVGIHHYAIYGINWFSRVSLISDEVATDATVFPIRNTLVPPTDVTVQYIQKEDQLLFTTAREQSWLKGRSTAFPDQDVNFSRTTFNWLDIVDISHMEDTSAEALSSVVKADKIKAHFKKGLPLEVIGMIKYIVPVKGSDTQLRLFTGSYTLIDGTIITPVITNENLFRFKDSLLSTPEGQFQVIKVEFAAQGPIITIEKAFETDTIEDPLDPGSFASQRRYISPEINSRFSVVENLGNIANWKQVASQISLLSLADPVQPNIESSVDVEGNITKYWVGGVTGNAVVAPMFGIEGASDNLPGYYKISFEGSLAPHPQTNLPYDPAHPQANDPSALRGAHVEWYKGNIRIPQVKPGADQKVLEVTIISQESPLVLYAYDPTYLDAPVLHSASDQNKVKVNFHPGYKAYLFPEPAPTYSFNGNNLLPAEGENDRKSLFSLQSADTLSGNDFVSAISVPVVLLARRIEEPVQLEAPLAPGLKVRPDATGKAAFTFDTRIAASRFGTVRSPFGFMFYRTTLEDVLHAFYQPDTITRIFTDLAALTEDPSYDLRAYELVNLIFNVAESLQFKVFEASPQPYGFPVPDKLQLTAPEDSLELKLNKLRAAIQGTLLPLTEQPPILSFLKRGYQTENALPVIRDIDGNLLSASNADFNPFPMVRKFTKAGEPNVTYVRFTDYVLNASSRNLYFYAGAEVTNQLMPGPLSPFAGPVTVLNVAPSDAPLISKFSLTPAYSSEQTASVAFEIAAMSPADQISKIRVYRSNDLAKTISLQTMNDYFDVEIEEGLNIGYRIVDDFSDLTVVPAGEMMHYRFAGIRTILNERGTPEEVLSKGSAVTSVKLIDAVNPEAPDLNYDAASSKLSWLPTTPQGTYHLFKQNKRGNWERIYSVQPQSLNGPVEYVLTDPLALQDEDGNRIYHRFKVQTQNASGLFNLIEKELTI